MTPAKRFAPISIRPQWKQLVITQLPYILLLPAAIAAAILFPAIWLAFSVLAAVILLYLIYKILYLARIEYVLTGEQLIFLHGVITHSTDYMELYRVIDYQQNRTLMQQMAGLKTVTVFSGDRNTPRLDLMGISEKVDVVGEIRRRVEYNKERRHIYEITNRN